jgi:hypothetical protein
MLEVVISTLWIAMILFVLYDTDAAYAYLKRMPFLNRLTHIEEYKKGFWEENGVSYSLFLQTQKPSFLSDLCSCRYCLGFWIALAFCPISGIMNVPITYLGSQLIYSIFTTLENWLKSKKENADE